MREFHRQTDWWLHHAIDDYMRSAWVTLTPIAEQWEQYMWFDLLNWAADFEVEWQRWW